MAKKPQIEAEAILNLVLDENSLKGQLTKALGSTVKEAAKSVNLGDELASPQKLSTLRKNLAAQFQSVGKDLAQGMNLAQNEELSKVLDRTRRDTVKRFKRDIDDLLSGQGRTATRSLPGLPQLGKEMREELQQAIRLFGRESLRSGSYRQREPQLAEAGRNVEQINKVLKELAGLPAVAARDLQSIRSIVNDKDTGRYLRMQKQEREQLARSSQALQLQTQNLNKLAGTLSKMGFGDAATEIRAANQARKALVTQFSSLTTPANIEARSRQEARAQARVEQQTENARRAALRREVKQREVDQKSQGTYQTVLGERRAGRFGPGILATMDDATRARAGYKPREDYRAASLAQISTTNAKADATLAGYNDAIRKNGDAMLAARAKYQQDLADQERRQEEQRQKQETRAQEKRQSDIAKAQEKSRRKAMAAEENARRQGGVYTPAGFTNAVRQYGVPSIGTVAASGPSAERDAQRAALLRLLAARRDENSLRLGDIGDRGAVTTLSEVREQTRRQEREAAARRREERQNAGGGGGDDGGRGTGGRRGEFERIVGNFGSYAIGYGSLYELLNLVGKLKDEVIELDRAFFSIKAVTQATDIEMKAISRSIREVALNTNFTTKEIAGAAEVLGQAGVAPAEMDKVLSATAQFASATNSSLSDAADLLTTVRTVFKELDDNTIANQLTKAINLSKLTSEDLKTILSLTAQTAGSYNINLEQLLAGVTTLRNAGVKPSTVATGLRQAMLEVFNPDTATMKALQARYAQMNETVDGKAITGQQIAQRFFGFTNAENPLIAALTELKRIGFTDEGQTSLQRGVDIRAFNAIQGLLANFKELEEAESKINFGQAAAEGAEIQMKSLSATMENLGASIVVLAEQMSNGLVRSLAATAKEATDVIEKLSDLDLEMKVTGGAGLDGIGAGALAGAVTGFATGKGVKGKLIGAGVGAIGGGYLTGGSDLNEGFGVGDAVGTAAAVATLVPLAMKLAGFFKWAGEAAKIVAPAASAVGAAEGAIAASGGAAAVATTAKVGARFIPVVGWILTAITALDLLADLLPEDQTRAIRARADAASAQAAKIKQRLEANTSLVEDFNPNAEKPKEGTAAAGFARYRDQVENFNLSLQDTFGQLTEDQAKGVTNYLQQYASQTFSQRRSPAMASQLQSILGDGFDTSKLSDKILFDLGQQREQVDATVTAFVDNTRQTIVAVTERIRAARESGDKITEKDAAMAQAFSENNEQLQAILDKSTNLDPGAQQQAIEGFYARFVEIVDQRPTLQAQERAKLMESLSAQLAAAIASSNTPVEISQAVSQIGGSLEFIGLQAKERLGSILAGLQQGRLQVNAQIKELEDQTALGPRAGGGGMLGRLFGFGGGEAGEKEQAERLARLAELRKAGAALDDATQQTTAAFERRAQQQAEANSAFTSGTGNRVNTLLSTFTSNPDIQRSLTNPTMLREMGISPRDQKFLAQYQGALTGGDQTQAIADLSVNRTAEDGTVKAGQAFERLDQILKEVANNVDRVTKQQVRQKRDQENFVQGEDIAAKVGAETDIKKADYGKNFSLLAGDTPDNPVNKLFAAERVILEKELRQAKAKLSDAKEDGSKTSTEKEQAVIEAQAKLDTLDLERQQKLAQYQAKQQTAAEQQQRKAEAAQRKQDAEDKKQAHIKVTQTGIEQRIVKQDFDEAIKTGSVEQFQAQSDKYVEVQQKLRDQLEEELKARGYNTSQILDEIKLREDLNKPLAEQVENIRKLAAQRESARELDYRVVGTGPDLGGKQRTAFYGADGFTREEQAAAAVRDVTLLEMRRAETEADLNNSALNKDDQTKLTLTKKLEELDTQIGTTKRNLVDLTSTDVDDQLGQVFDPRKMTIALENTQYTVSKLGDNLRNGLVSGLDSAADSMARLAVQGGSVKETLVGITQQLGQEALSTFFKTGIRQGALGLTQMLSSDKAGGEPGVVGAGAEGDTGVTGLAKKGASSFLGGVASLFGGGKEGGPEGVPTMQTVATMNVTASMVNVTGGVGAGAPAIPGVGNIPNGAQAPGGVNPAAAGATGNTNVATQTGGSWTGVASGALTGAGIGAALGAASGKKKGSQWGAIAGALIGAYFGVPTGGFGMAEGGRISPSGMVIGSGAKGVDSVPVTVKGTGQAGLLAPGEGVLNAKAMDALGPSWLNSANNGKLFRKAAGGVIDASQNATQRLQSQAAQSVARSAPASSEAPVVNLKNVNVFEPSAVRGALQNREGEDTIINMLKKRGAIN